MRKLGERYQKRIASLLLVAYMITAVFTGDAFALTAQAATAEGISRSGEAQSSGKISQTEEAREALQEIVRDRDVMAVVYMSDTYPVRTVSSNDGAVVADVPSGQTVFIRDVFSDDRETWVYVSFYMGDKEYQGYIPRGYLACSDERFLAWEEEYGTKQGGINLYAAGENASEGTNTGKGSAKNKYADIEQFPESYQAALKKLKDKHPNWIFVPMKTGLKWKTVIANEIGDGKSLVHKSLPDYTKEGAYDGGSWYYASEDILKYYMDPRNSLTEEAIFQYEQLTYNETYHTEEALEKFLQNTFMKGDTNAPGTGTTYAHIIWSVGQEDERKVSPFHLASRIYQEQGDGTSPLISGTYPGYEGYYNYFNVGATGTTDKEVIENGLKYAKNANPPWSDAYYSILGGADVISANYIRKGQDTLYLQKYNVNPKGQYALYTHQYMQNISAPTSEAKSIYNLYKSADALENSFVFKIPVYEGMPAKACAMPTKSYNVVLKIPKGYDTTVYLDGVPYSAKNRNGQYIINAKNKKAETAVVYKYNKYGVPTGMYVWTLTYKDGTYTEKTCSGLKNLLSYHGFSIRITGKAGIRLKTGISETKRATLLDKGVSGYKLKEYGTLVMNKANLGEYPMVKGGEKVLSGMSYGVDENNKKVDKIYETVDGRIRYTSVLVGLPAEQYKVEYAFRGYAVLEKSGEEIIIYGPIMAKSIYSLAEQILDGGTYEEGSDAEKFLKKLIKDAEKAEKKAEKKAK